jgi:hypothetical protein
VPKDPIREAAYRSGVIIQIYLGPKTFQILEGNPKDLPPVDVQLANEARSMLEKILPALKIRTELPPITPELGYPRQTKQGAYPSLMHLIKETETGLGETYGKSTKDVYRFAWVAAYYMLELQYIPHREHEIRMSHQSLQVTGGLAGLGEDKIQAFTRNPKAEWESTFDPILEKEEKKSFFGRFGPRAKGLQFDLPGELVDDLIRRWLTHLRI